MEEDELLKRLDTSGDPLDAAIANYQIGFSECRAANALLEKKLVRAIQALNRACEATYYEKPNFEDGTFAPTYREVIEEALKEIEKMK